MNQNFTTYDVKIILSKHSDSNRGLHILKGKILFQISIQVTHRRCFSVLTVEFEQVFFQTITVKIFNVEQREFRPASKISKPANIYLFKVNNRNTRKGMKYVQS